MKRRHCSICHLPGHDARSHPRTKENPLGFRLGRSRRRREGGERSRAPTRNELAEQLYNARARADRASARLRQAKTDNEREEALRLAKNALRHLISVERRAEEQGVNKAVAPGLLAGVFRGPSARPAEGLEHLIEEAEDTRRFSRQERQRERERPRREAEQAEKERRRELERVKKAAERAEKRQSKGKAAARTGEEEEPRPRRSRRKLGAASPERRRRVARSREEAFARLEKRERGRRKERSKEDVNAALRQLATGHKTPRQSMSGEEAAIALRL